MKLKKNFLVLTTLFILLGSNMALAVSDVTDTTISGEPAISGDTNTSSGDIVPNVSGEESGEFTPESGEVSGELSGDELENILLSTANDSNFTISKNEILNGAMEATVSGDETFIFTVITEPSNGTVTHADPESPSFTYVPSGDFVGEDSFTFRLESGDLYSNVGTISITVEGEPEIVIPFDYADMQNHWANYSASHLAARGYIIGEQVGNKFYYKPDKTMTRGEFLLFILSIVDPNNTANEAEITFADEENVPSWMLKKAKQAYELEIISGVGGTNSIYLYADKVITRAEAFVMINNALLAMTNTVNSSEELEYVDSKTIPSWAVQAIKNLSAYKILQGDSDKMINASSVVTRGQAAELCYKLLKQLETSALTPSGDLK